MAEREVDDLTILETAGVRLLVLRASPSRTHWQVAEIAQRIEEVAGVPVVVLEHIEQLTKLDDDALAALGLRRIEAS